MFSKPAIVAIPLLAGFILPFVSAQTFTSCNPLHNSDCPPDIALGIANYSISLATQSMSTTVWNTTAGTIVQGDLGAEFTINQRGDSPTVKTNFHIFFGQVEVIMRAATGTGIISSIVLESDDLDEVDWEFMGGNTTHVETNYFGKGNTTSYNRAIYYPVETPQQLFHNYTVNWSSESLEWYIDGVLVRTLLYADANGGYDFPQTPLDVRLGIWAGGDSSEPQGTIEWAGGLTNYDNAPFTMFVQSVRVSDASRGTEYKYGDETGSWQSIQVLNSTKAIALDGNNAVSTSQSISEKWHSLSHTSQIAIIASVAGVVGIVGLLSVWCCIKQRRAGAREKVLEDAAFEKTTAENMALRAEMARQRAMHPQAPQGYSYNAGFGSRGYQRY